VNRSKDGMMLVEDPEDTIKTMCFFQNKELDVSDYKAQYEKLKGFEKPIHKKNAHTHFYSLTLLKLLVPISGKKAKYQLSPIAKDLCRIVNDSNKSEEYQQKFSNLLLTNEDKGELFKKFLDFVSTKRNKKEIYEIFKPIPSRSMISWLSYAGLLEQKKDIIQAKKMGKTGKISLAKFEQVFIKAYHELNKSEIFGIRRIYIPIEELQFHISVETRLSKDAVYDMLTKLILKDKSEKIILHGASTKAYEDNKMDKFNYNNKDYVFLSLRSGEWKNKD